MAYHPESRCWFKDTNSNNHVVNIINEQPEIDEESSWDVLNHLNEAQKN